MAKKALLMILDGWGIGNHSKADVIFNTPTPYWDYLVKTYPNSQLQASGENVGFLINGPEKKGAIGKHMWSPSCVWVLIVVIVSKDMTILASGNENNSKTGA